MLRTLLETYPKSELTGDAAGTADFPARAATSSDGSTESANLLYEAVVRARSGDSTAQAVDLYQTFLKVRPADDLRAASARIYLAEQYSRQGRDAETERLARETIAATPMTGTPHDLQQAQLVLAQARLIFGDGALRRFEAMRVAEPLAAGLQRKQQATEAALTGLRAAAAYGFADVSLASYYKIGYAQPDFANAVMQAPRPKTLSADQREQYDAALRQQMQPYREGAEKAFRATLEQGKNADVENEWTARALSSLVEFGATPGGVAPTSAVAPAAASPPVS